MQFLSRTRRPRRPGEWTPENAVTFIVTLAATGSVTLAAQTAGMSRKSAYALKKRDPAFDYAWVAAMRASEGNKVEEVEGPSVSPRYGNASPSRRDRERAFGGLVSILRDWNPARTSASALNP